MLKNIKKYLKEVVIFLIGVTIFANALSLYKSADLNKQPLSLRTLNLINAQAYSIDSNKPILIHFWATWCPTCKVEASNIQSISEHYNVLTIAVKSGTNQEIQTWLNENNYTFNVYNDAHAALSSEYNIGAFPTTLIYNKNKELIFSDVGYTSTWGLMLRMWWAEI